MASFIFFPNFKNTILKNCISCCLNGDHLSYWEEKPFLQILLTGATAKLQRILRQDFPGTPLPEVRTEHYLNEESFFCGTYWFYQSPIEVWTNLVTCSFFWAAYNCVAGAKPQVAFNHFSLCPTGSLIILGEAESSRWQQIREQTEWRLGLWICNSSLFIFSCSSANKYFSPCLLFSPPCF